MIVHPRRQTAHPVFIKGIGGHGQNRRGLASGQAADQSGCFNAVQLRHLHVHQNQVIGGRRGLFHRLHAVFGQIHVQSGGVQQFKRDFLIDRVIFGQQDAGVAMLLRHDLFGGDAGKGGAQADRLLNRPAQSQAQHRGSHRFDQHIAQTGLTRLVAQHRFVERRDQQSQRLAGQPQGLHALRGFQTIQTGHLPVQQQQIKRTAFRLGFSQRSQRRRAGIQRSHGQFQITEHIGERGPGFGQIIHHQRPAALQAQIAHRRQRLSAFRQAGGEPEDAAHARLAFRAGGPAHQLGQPSGDGQSQAGAAILARRRIVQLPERIEQARQCFRGDADPGVLHLETHQQIDRTFLQNLRPQDNRAAFGEFQGVAGIVEQRLREAHRVAVQPRRQAGGVHHQLQTLGLRPVGNQGADIAQNAFDFKIGLLQAQPSGLDLGDVQNIIDDA